MHTQHRGKNGANGEENRSSRVHRVQRQVGDDFEQKEARIQGTYLRPVEYVAWAWSGLCSQGRFLQLWVNRMHSGRHMVSLPSQSFPVQADPPIVRDTAARSRQL